ncbi:hypothetical protein M5689_019564 [Euphorbia peplus]|nr:hypothetical protein M5689_019564 [Euphorbia peplus]
MSPMSCSPKQLNCGAFLYHINTGTQNNPKQIASFYNVTRDQLQPILRGNREDYLVSVFASCRDINGTIGYFYQVPYTVQENDTFFNVSTEIFSGQVWEIGNEEEKFVPGDVVTLNLLSGCVDSKSQVVGTYTVQQSDSIEDIATRLFSSVDGIEKLNTGLIRNPNFLVVGWVLFVPVGVSPAPR